MKKKIIVTGGLGFIGSNLCKLLIDKGFFVINIDKISYASSFYNTLDFKSLIKGKKLSEIKSLKQNTTWGEGSVFDWLYKKL